MISIEIEYKCNGHKNRNKNCPFLSVNDSVYCASENGGQCTNKQAQKLALIEEMEEIEEIESKKNNKREE